MLISCFTFFTFKGQATSNTQEALKDLQGF